MTKSEWPAVVMLMLMPIVALAMFEGAGYLRRRKERARAQRSKQRESVNRR